MGGCIAKKSKTCAETGIENYWYLSPFRQIFWLDKWGIRKG